MTYVFRLPLELILRILANAPAGWTFDKDNAPGVGPVEYTTLRVTPPAHLNGRDIRDIYSALRAAVEKIESAGWCRACDDMKADGHNADCPEGPPRCSACDAPAEVFDGICGICLGL